jgi:hypothetical protein
LKDFDVHGRLFEAGSCSKQVDKNVGHFESREIMGELADFDSILVFGMLAPGNQPSVANGRSEDSKTQVIGRIGNLYRAGWEDWIYGANCFDHTVAGPSRDRQYQVWK